MSVLARGISSLVEVIKDRRETTRGVSMESAVKFMSIGQLAALTGLHRTTISRMISAKKIPCVRLGKRALIDATFADDLLRKARESIVSEER